MATAAGHAQAAAASQQCRAVLVALTNNTRPKHGMSAVCGGWFGTKMGAAAARSSRGSSRSSHCEGLKVACCMQAQCMLRVGRTKRHNKLPAEGATFAPASREAFQWRAAGATTPRGASSVGMSLRDSGRLTEWHACLAACCALAVAQNFCPAALAASPWWSLSSVTNTAQRLAKVSCRGTLKPLQQQACVGGATRENQPPGTLHSDLLQAAADATSCNYT